MLQITFRCKSDPFLPTVQKSQKKVATQKPQRQEIEKKHQSLIFQRQMCPKGNDLWIEWQKKRHLKDGNSPNRIPVKCSFLCRV